MRGTPIRWTPFLGCKVESIFRACRGGPSKENGKDYLQTYEKLRLPYKEGQVKEALKCLELINQEGISTCSDVYICILQKCMEMKDLTAGKEIHDLIIKNGVKANIFLGNILVNMYIQCGSLVDAREVFDKLQERDLITWTVMMSGYANYGYHEDTLKLHNKMEEQSIKPDDVAFICVLQACANLAALEKGKQVHCNIIQCGYEMHLFVGSTLIDFYAKCRSVNDAHEVFNCMFERSVVSWNALIAGYATGHAQEVFKLFQVMESEGINPDDVTFVSVLKACAGSVALEQGRRIHSRILYCGLKQNIFVGSTLVDMYTKCGQVVEARRVFDDMSTKNVVTWSAMIAGYAQQGHSDCALELFQQMEHEGVKPNKVTLASILKACSNLRTGKQIHDHMIRCGFGSDAFVGNSLVDMYANYGSLENALRVFDKMLIKSAVSWNLMIGAYAQHGYKQEALDFFELMRGENVIPDEVTYVNILKICTDAGLLKQGKQIYTHILISGLESVVSVGSSLVVMYTKIGSLEDACKVFDQMPQRNVICWNAMLSGYAFLNNPEAAINLYVHMLEEGVKPDEATFVSALKSCANLADLEQSKKIHDHIIKGGFESGSFVENGLVDTYAKCGSIEDACQLFYRMLKRDLVSWNVMIGGYAQHGQAEEAFHLSQEMEQEGTRFDHITFVGLLSACSHAGLVERGHYYFHSMSRDHGITPTAKHYACMVDLIGRAGRLEDAVDLVKKIPLQPSVAIWTALLGACRLWIDMGLAKCAAECVLELEPENASACVLLSNIYAAVGKWEDGANVGKLMLVRGVEKKPGCSCIDVNSQLHLFTAKDSYPDE